MRPGTPGGGAGRVPGFVELDDPLRPQLAAAPLRHPPEEHLRDDVSGLLQALVLTLPLFEQRPQVGRHREHAPLAVLARARVDLDSPALTSTLRHSSGNTSLAGRQPVM
jgi:hypothetical protein